MIKKTFQNSFMEKKKSFKKVNLRSNALSCLDSSVQDVSIYLN